MKRLVVGSSVFLDPQFRVMYDVAESGLSVGEKVVFTSCNGVCHSCVANPHGGRPQCWVCRKVCSFLERRFRGRAEIIHFPNVEHNVRHFEYSSLAQLKDIVYKGVNVGYGACSMYVTVTRDLLEIITPEKRRYMDAFLNEACRYVDVAEKLFDTVKPDCVSVFNGRLSEARPFYELARLRNIPVDVNEVATVNVKPDLMEFRHFVFKNCLPHDVDGFAAKIRECWDFPNRSEEEKVKIANLFFQDRRRGVAAGDAMTPGTDGIFIHKQVKGCLPEGFDESKHNIVIFNSSEDELSSIDKHFESHALFLSQIDGIKAVCRLLNGRTDYHIYLRVHPNLIGVNQPYHLDLYKLDSEYANLTVIAADSKISTYDLIDVAEKVVVFCSTTGVEATYARKPVILAGSALYYKLDVAYEPHDEDELLKLLISSDLAPRPQLDSLKYGYFLKQRADISTPAKVIDMRVQRRLVYCKCQWVPIWPKIPGMNLLFRSPLTDILRKMVRCFARNLLPNK